MHNVQPTSRHWPLAAPTSHAAQAAIEKLMEGRTVMVIAHRLSTVQNADQVGGWGALADQQLRSGRADATPALNEGRSMASLRSRGWGPAGMHQQAAALPPMCCPQIVVLEGGQVVEQGSHKQLLRRPGGRYAALVSAQELLLQQT